SLSGLKIRVTPIYEPFVRVLDGIPVTMAPGEVYIALERGVVDGFGWPSIGVSDLGWQEAVKYIIGPGFYQTDVCVLFNLNSWKRLDEKTRNLLIGVMEKVERESYELSQEMAKKEREFLVGKGLKFIEFKGKEGKEYLDKAFRSGWDRVIAKSPVTGNKLREMMEK
ncbi:MAG: TRAP transporter substrate-binding protein DctP, partial [Candidatus Contubernalis sp.]|nr:TRAP transporter substrate-binding protein DctP [Candidatus Contubernalis sp.]